MWKKNDMYMLPKICMGKNGISGLSNTRKARFKKSHHMPRQFYYNNCICLKHYVCNVLQMLFN